MTGFDDCLTVVIANKKFGDEKSVFNAVFAKNSGLDF